MAIWAATHNSKLTIITSTQWVCVSAVRHWKHKWPDVMNCPVFLWPRYINPFRLLLSFFRSTATAAISETLNKHEKDTPSVHNNTGGNMKRHFILMTKPTDPSAVYVCFYCSISKPLIRGVWRPFSRQVEMRPNTASREQEGKSRGQMTTFLAQM